jgi:hypothetical protein
LEKVRITHPNHPLQGQQLTVLKTFNYKTEPSLVLLLPDGSHLTVPLSWTNQAQPSADNSSFLFVRTKKSTNQIDPTQLPQLSPGCQPVPLLSLEGLYQILLLIEQWQRHSGNSPCASCQGLTCSLYGLAVHLLSSSPYTLGKRPWLPPATTGGSIPYLVNQEENMIHSSPLLKQNNISADIVWEKLSLNHQQHVLELLAKLAIKLIAQQLAEDKKKEP